MKNRHDERLENQYFIDSTGTEHKFLGDAENTVSIHYEIARSIYPDDDRPNDKLMELGWILMGSSVYSSPIIHKEPTQAQINTLHDKGLLKRLCILNNGFYLNYLKKLNKQQTMEQYKIRILKDTPFDKAGDVIPMPEFREKYAYLAYIDNTDEFVVKYLSGETKLAILSDESRSFFEIAQNKFSIGDCVWHENQKKAYYIVHHVQGKGWKPNYVTLEAANKYTDVYKRLATKEEEDRCSLTLFCDEDVLIGRSKCYYFNGVWKELIGVSNAISVYINRPAIGNIETLVGETSEVDSSWKCNFVGLKVGCKVIYDDEIVKIAKVLKLIP